MTIHSAQQFIKRAMSDSSFRGMLEDAPDQVAREQILEDTVGRFSPGELEEARTSLLFQCQFEEQAVGLNHALVWWSMCSSQ